MFYRALLPASFGLLVACSGDATPDRVEDSTGCIYRNGDPGDNGPISVYGRALAGAGTLYVNPESGMRPGNTYTMRWESGSEQETEIDGSGRIPISIQDLEAGEQIGNLLDRKGDVALYISLTLVETGEPVVICAGQVLEDGSAQEPQPFDDPMTLRAWTQDAQGLELVLWIYEYDAGLFNDTIQSVGTHREILEQDNVTGVLELTYPRDDSEIGGLELVGLARLLDESQEQVGEDVFFPLSFE